MAHVLDAIIQLKDNFSSTIKTVEKNVGSFSRTAKRMGRDIQRVGKDLESLGSNMTKKVTLPTMALGAASLKSAMDFEDGLAKVSTIADSTKMSLQDIRKELLRVSDATGIAVTDLAEAEYNAISAGVDTAKSIEFLEVATKTSKAGFADMNTTIDALTTTLNAYGLETEKAMDISNQMLKAQDYGKTTVAEMGASLGNVIPIATQLGVSTEELFASMATLTKNGIKTSEAVTGLKAAYSNILKPSKQASDLAESLGLNFNAAHLQSVGWAKFLDEVKEKTGGNAEMMAKLFGSVQGLNAVMVLTGKGSKDFNNVLSQMGDVAGLTDEKFEQLLTPAQKLKIEFNKLKNAGIEFGVELIPLVTQFTEKLGQVTEKIKNLSPEQRQMIVKFAGMAAIMGPVIGVIGKMTTGVGKMVTEFGFFAGRVKNLGLIGAIFTPGVKVALVLAALAAGAILVYKNWDRIKETFQNVKERLDELFGLSDKIEFLKELLTGMAVNLREKMLEAWEAIKPLREKIGDLFIALGEFAKMVAPILMPVLEFLGGVFAVGFSVAFNTIVNIVSTVISTIATILGGIIDILTGVITFVTGVFTGDWEMAMEGVQTIVEGVVDIITGLWQGLIDLLTAPIDAVVNLIDNKFGEKAQGIIDAWGKVKSFLKHPIKGTVNLVRKGADWIGGKLGIGQNYKGTMSWRGGPTWVHERGGEIIDLPRGTRIYPHDKSVRMAREQGRKESQTQTIVQRLIPVEIPNIKDQVQKVVQELKTVSIPNIKDQTQTIKQRLIPVKVPNIDNQTQTISQKLNQINIPNIKDQTQTIVQKLIPANIKEPIPLEQPIKREIIPIRNNNAKEREQKTRGNNKTEINIPKLADQIIVREESDIDKIAQAIAREIEKASLNMA